jgi:tetratricopeptide (TPR) repeat protein
VQDAPGSALLGRADAWRRACHALERGAAGVGGVVLVSGEAGIGKTSFCDALLVEATRDGWSTAWAAVPPASTVPGLWAWRHLLATLDGGDLPHPVSEGDPGAARIAQFDAIVDRLTRAAARVPVLVVLDDAHWADPTTLAMVLHFATASRGVRGCLVVTYRPEDADAATPLGAVLPGLRRLSTGVALTALDRKDVAALAADVAGGIPLDDEVIDAVTEATGGNPLFVSELVRLFEGRVPTAPGDLPTPPAVAAIVGERIARLSDWCREVLALASAMASDIELSVLARALDAEPADVLVGVDEAIRAAVLRERATGHFEFRHPLFQSAVYESLGTAGRAAEHARIANALEAARADGAGVELAALAHHFGRSAPLGNAGKATQYAIAAGDEAMAALSYETASARYAQALATLDLDPSAGDRIAVLLARADADAAVGRSADAAAAYEAAGELATAAGRVDEVTRAALGRTGGAGMDVPTDDVARAILERALTVVGRDQPATRARLLARLSVVLGPTAPVTAREQLVVEASDLAAAANDPLAAADVAVAGCHVHAGPRHVELRLAEAARIVENATATRQLRLELLGRRLRLEALLEAGRFADATAEVTEYERRAELVRDPSYEVFVPLWRGALALAAGDDAGYRLERTALGHVLARLPAGSNGRVLAAVQEFFHEIDRTGDAAAAEAVFGLLTASIGVGLPPQVAISEALVHALAGRADDARAELDEWATRIRALPEDAEWLPAVVQLADIASLVGGHVLVDWARERLEPLAEVWSVEGIGAAIRGPVARALGALADAAGDAGDAARHRARAAELASAGGVAVWARPEHAADAAGARLVNEGDVWVVAFGGVVARVRDSKGMRDIAELVSRPGVAIAVLDLAGAGSPILAEADVGPVLDATARTQYRRRLTELEQELEDADRDGDIGRSERLSAERDLLVAELAAAHGLGGRGRRTGSSAERARTAVTTRIKDALKRLDTVHPDAGRHLRRAVKTGTFCVYDPEPAVVWEVVRPRS